MTVDVSAWPVDTARAYCDARESASARESFGAPFVTASATRALVAMDSSDSNPVAAIVFTMAGGVAAIDAFAPHRDHHEVGAALMHKFQEAASYNNCHKMIARAKRNGVEHLQLERLGFRVTAVVERHHFQADFVDLVKWLA